MALDASGMIVHDPGGEGGSFGALTNLRWLNVDSGMHDADYMPSLDTASSISRPQLQR